MSPTGVSGDQHAASAKGGKPLIKAGIVGKGAAGLVAALLTVGGGSAVAMAASGGHHHGKGAHGAAQIVEECKDKVRVDDRDRGAGADADTRSTNAAGNSHGIGHCVSAAVHQRNAARKQGESGAKDVDERTSPSPGPTSGQHDNGQGSGNQGEHGNGTRGDHGKADGHGHQPSPRPST